MTLPGATATVEELRSLLRAAVLRELARRGLDDADALAGCLNVLPGTAAGILKRSTWPVQTSFWLVRELRLPIRVVVHDSGVDDHEGQPGGARQPRGTMHPVG